jgi:hypothetical protein
VSRNDLILSIAAALLVGFALVVSLVIPRRNPGFPGRHLGLLILIGALLVIGMLTAVEVLGESHHFEAAERGGSCHTLSEANATGQVGPNLDDVLKGKSADFIHESIVDPNAEIANGFTAGVMPETYRDQLNDQQLADLVAFLAQATKS